MLAFPHRAKRCGTGSSDMIPNEIATEAEPDSAETHEPMTFAQTED